MAEPRASAAMKIPIKSDKARTVRIAALRMLTERAPAIGLPRCGPMTILYSSLKLFPCFEKKCSLEMRFNESCLLTAVRSGLTNPILFCA